MMNNRTRYLFSAALPLVAFVFFVGTGTYIDHKRAEPPTVNHDSDFKVPPVELPPPSPTFCKPWRPLVMGSDNVQECNLE